MGNPFFHFKKFSIVNQEKGLKVTTDACILGALANHNSPLKCLDIGTGNGVIALFLAQKYSDSKIDAIDIDPGIVKQAQSNIEKSIFSSQIKIETCDTLNYTKPYCYDLITCNPPYFSNHLQKASSEKNSAIHNKHLPLDKFIDSIKRLLKPEGIFWVIYPNHESEVFRKLAIQHQLFPKDEIKIYNKPIKLIRKITSYSFEETSQINERTLILKDEKNGKTKEFSDLMHPFYLENTELYQSRP
jgi:tRNA1Val (adenine37-N6)-methyltransferase